ASLTAEYKARAMSTTRPLPIDPWPVELPEYLQHVRVSPHEVRSYDATHRPDGFYQDDRHITAAGLALHPLLGHATVAALMGALSPAHPDVQYEPGTLLPELRNSGDAAIHLVIAGRARLVATIRTGQQERRRVLAQYRPGQWVGLPNLLRKDDGGAGWPDDSVRLHPEALTHAATPRI